MLKPALGRGLGALLGAAATSVSVSPFATHHAPAMGEEVRRVTLARVCPCPFQPRKDFAPEALQELANSIKEQGILQPLVVRARKEHFEIIAGERRWRAAQLAGLTEVPVIVREADDRVVMELALIENLQRENLNPIEEALGYGQLIEAFHLTQEQVAQKVGKSRTVVANALRLLKLAPELQAMLRDGRLSVGHAKVILGLATAAEQKLAAENVLKDSLSVRQTEDLVARLQQPKIGGGTANGKSIAAPKDIHVTDLENKLKQRLSTKVTLRYRAGKGSLDIRFFSDEELERILELLGVNAD